MAMEFELGFPYWRALRRKFAPESPFVAAGNIEWELLVKQAKVAHGDPMYECLVEGCDLTLKSYKSRQQHLVDKHKFPTSFEFFKKAPHKKRRQKNQRKQAYVMKEDASDMDVENEVTDVTDPTRKQKRKNQRKQANLKKPNASNMDVGNEDINNLVSSVSKLSTSDSSPSSISFGRRHTRGLTFVPRAVQREKKPNST